MIAIDTNILVYAHRQDSEFHAPAATLLRTLAEGLHEWSIAWPSVHEFFAIVTHPRIYRPPTPFARALAQLEAWLASPSLVLLGETQRHWETLRAMIVEAHIEGPKVHDARIAALCAQHGVRELYSADRDFSRFPQIAVRNPLIAV
ncbi:MAG TPA: TA system VapC family ribonuclease toxin [Rhodanobacteraceae bacterium]|nr:TA system VapC family ribonuclease toxin [Rhodanobacteraceae bacterium]